MADDGDQKRLLLTSRGPGASWDIYDDPSAPEIFVDGVGQFMFGPTVTRIGFYATRDLAAPDDGPTGVPIEKRFIVLRTVIPTPILIEWLANALAAFKENREGIEQTQAGLTTSIETALAKVRG